MLFTLKCPVTHALQNYINKLLPSILGECIFIVKHCKVTPNVTHVTVEWANYNGELWDLLRDR